MTGSLTICVVVAAGSGTRFADALYSSPVKGRCPQGGGVMEPFPSGAMRHLPLAGEELSGPKQYHPLHGVPLLRWTLQAMIAHPGIDKVIVAIREEDRALYENAALGLEKLLPPVIGGASRFASVANALAAISAHAPTYVLIHDGARACVEKNLIDRVLEKLQHHAAVIPVVPIEDTLKRVRENQITETISRDELVRAQTPQGFQFDRVAPLYLSAMSEEFTDDAALCEKNNIHVATVEGSRRNIKLTVQEDVAMVEEFLTLRSFDLRVGHGYDVHRFSENNSAPVAIRLCGVEVMHDASLIGHSDADVGLHALTDALLATGALGDIGLHFPPSNPEFKNADSSIFLLQALKLVQQKGGRVNHVDITIVAEAPKINPHRALMQNRIADLLSLTPDRVSIKATTTEMLGFTGRKEGIAAYAVATVVYS